MIPTWKEDTKTETFTERNGKVHIVPLIQLNTGKPLPFASIQDLDICVLWTTAQMNAAQKEDYTWWDFYRRLVVRFRNSIGKPVVPWTKALVMAEWTHRLEELEFLQSSTRDFVIAKGGDAERAWATYTIVVLAEKSFIDAAYTKYYSQAKT